MESDCGVRRGVILVVGCQFGDYVGGLVVVCLLDVLCETDSICGFVVRVLISGRFAV